MKFLRHPIDPNMWFKKASMTKDAILHLIETTLQPETDLERYLILHPEFQEGLLWGVPRYGHPEGEIYKHIREVLDNIDRLSLDILTRSRLRIIAFLHDTFKNREDKLRPRDWSKHHAVLARQFAEQFIDDPVVLEIIELHDEAYYCWRMQHLYQQPEAGLRRLRKLLARIDDQLQLYYLFFKCDTCTGDKNPAPLHWFERTIPGIEVVDL